MSDSNSDSNSDSDSDSDSDSNIETHGQPEHIAYPLFQGDTVVEMKGSEGTPREARITDEEEEEEEVLQQRCTLEGVCEKVETKMKIPDAIIPVYEIATEEEKEDYVKTINGILEKIKQSLVGKPSQNIILLPPEPPILIDKTDEQTLKDLELFMDSSVDESTQEAINDFIKASYKLYDTVEQINENETELNSIESNERNPKSSEINQYVLTQEQNNTFLIEFAESQQEAVNNSNEEIKSRSQSQ